MYFPRCISFKIYFFKNLFIYLFIYLFRDRREEREKHQYVISSLVSPTRDLAGTPGIYPVGESTGDPFGSQADAQSTEPHQPGQKFFDLEVFLSVMY